MGDRNPGLNLGPDWPLITVLVAGALAITLAAWLLR